MSVICINADTAFLRHPAGEGGVMDTSAEKEKEIIKQRLLEKSVNRILQ